jgi:hypothetical protein
MPIQKQVASKLTDEKRKSGGWNQAIADAKEKIRKLRFAIRTFELNRDAGRVWPGDEFAAGQVDTHSSRQQHSD